MNAALWRDQVIEVMENLLSLMLHIPLEPAQDVPPVREGSELLHATVHILGDWCGTVSLTMTEEMANQVARHFFDLGIDNPDRALVEDACRELTNITGGNLKSLLGQQCILSTPKIVECDSLDFAAVGCDQVVAVPFTAQGEVLIVRVHEDEINLDYIRENYLEKK